MKISKQAKREAKELFRHCLTDGLLDEGRVRNSVQHVLQTQPRGYVAILMHFLRLLKLDIERRTGRVETATPLSQEIQSKVQSKLEKTYGPGLQLSFGQNSALIGGMRIQVGSDVYDGSVQGKLNALRESFE